MERRTFLRQSVTAGATVVGVPDLTRASERFDLVDEVGHSVIAFIDGDWNTAELEDAISDAVDVVCYAYGKLETVDDEVPDREPGYLRRLGNLGWEELKDNPEAYDWILDYAGRLTDFVGSLDVFSDRIGEKLDAVTESADGV